MRIILAIENLASGGAQRQLVLLAKQLALRGAEVRFLTYYPEDFFQSELEPLGISVTVLPSKPYWYRVLAFRSAVRRSAPDVVVAFLGTAAALAEVASLPWRSFPLVVSERSGRFAGPQLRDRVYFQLHRLADVVVSNSEYLASYVTEHAPWLRSKVTVIRNCVDLEQFHPPTDPLDPQGERRTLLVIGRFSKEKNAIRLAQSLVEFRRRHGQIPFTVHWYGDKYYRNGAPTEASSYYESVTQEIAKHQLESSFVLHDHRRDLREIYQQATAFCLPSLRESFSNVLSEAAATGKPLLASNVGDNAVLVREGRNGMLFDPKSTLDITRCLEFFSSRSPEQLKEMGSASRRIAEDLLHPGRFAQQYIELLERLTGQPLR